MSKKHSKLAENYGKSVLGLRFRDRDLKIRNQRTRKLKNHV